MRQLTVLVAVIAVAACTSPAADEVAGPPTETPDGAAEAPDEPPDEAVGPLPDVLVGRVLVATSVEEDGTPVLLGGPLNVHVQDGSIRWRISCNIAGGTFEATDERLVPTPPGTASFASTAIECEPEASQQDGWIAEVFAQGPRWHADGDEVVLSTDRVTIELTDGTWRP